MPPTKLIDEEAHRRNRDRAAKDFDTADYLKKEVSDRIIDRIDTIRRDFPHVLDVGCHTGTLTQALINCDKISRVSALDPSSEMVAATQKRLATHSQNVEVHVASYDNLLFENGPFDDLKFSDLRFDGIFSAFALHWANDLPGVLIQLKKRLKPDGVMIVALAGGATLATLRACLATAETEISGGLSPRVLPMGDLRDMSGLIARAGLTMPVADSDTITVSYPNAFKLMAELRMMGEGNALAGRLKHMTRRAVLMRTAALYHERCTESDGRITAQFEIITLTGWTPPQEETPKAP